MKPCPKLEFSNEQTLGRASPAILDRPAGSPFEFVPVQVPLLNEVDRRLDDRVERRDDFGIRLVAAFGHDQVGELL